MSRSACIWSWALLAAGCALSHRPEPDAADAGERASPEQPPEAECTPCGERQSMQEHLRCLCGATHCPTDLQRALRDESSFVAYGDGCGHAWLIDRVARGYSLYVYARRSGSLVYMQYTTGDGSVACEDGTEQLISEAGRVPECGDEQMDWCKFPHAASPIGIGELDSARTCDERMMR